MAEKRGKKGVRCSLLVTIYSHPGLLPTQIPALLPSHPRAKIRYLSENSLADFDISLTDDNFIRVNSPRTGLEDAKVSTCVLDSINVSISASWRNFDATLSIFVQSRDKNQGKALK